MRTDGISTVLMQIRAAQLDKFSTVLSFLRGCGWPLNYMTLRRRLKPPTASGDGARTAQAPRSIATSGRADAETKEIADISGR